MVKSAKKNMVMGVHDKTVIIYGAKGYD